MVPNRAKHYILSFLQVAGEIFCKKTLGISLTIISLVRKQNFFTSNVSNISNYYFLPLWEHLFLLMEKGIILNHFFYGFSMFD